jgi:uncharacterized CHY-type Zn-finger protein
MTETYTGNSPIPIAKLVVVTKERVWDKSLCIQAFHVESMTSYDAFVESIDSFCGTKSAQLSNFLMENSTIYSTGKNRDGKERQLARPASKQVEEQSEQVVRMVAGMRLVLEQKAEPRASNGEAKVEVKERARVTPRPVPKPVMKLNQVPTDPLEKQQFLRKMEIQQLQTRYGAIVEQKDDHSILLFELKPTDPDFPFDLASLSLRLLLPPGYPVDRDIQVTVQNPEIPVALKRNIQRFLIQKVERTRSSLLDICKLLDRDLESLLIDKDEMKVTIVRPGERNVRDNAEDPKRLFSEPSVNCEEGLESQHASGASENGSDIDESDHEREEIDPSTEDSASEAEDWNPQGINVGKLTEAGIAIVLQDLILTNIGSLSMDLLEIQMRCERCKMTFEKQVPSSLGHERQTSHVCTRCANVMMINYRAQMVVPHSARLGLLDCIQCTPVDLLASDMYIHCEGCSHILKLRERPLFVSTLCRKCHTKLSLTSSVRFSRVGGPSKAVRIARQETKKQTIVGLEGDGSCEHYKKSKRFFRFPCCGKCFPCDICHDSKSNHPADWATKMVCGLCRTEQSVSQACRSCRADVTGNKKSRFWEGGKGTRNQAAMSRNDKRKYRGQSKTVSNRSRKE